MAYRDQYSIRQGKIVLYKRSSENGIHQSESWYCALKIAGNKTIRRSLKTTDKNEAESLAENLLFELSQRTERGLSLSTKRFELVSNHFIKDIKDKMKQDSLLPTDKQRFKKLYFENKQRNVQKYLNPYFDKKNLQDISDQDVMNYEHWRRNYWISGEGSQLSHIEYKRNGLTIKKPMGQLKQKEPSWNTINKELTTLRDVFEFARRSNIIEGREIPTIKNVKKPSNTISKKPGLTEQEVKLLLTTLVTRYKHQSNPKHKRSHKLLMHYISWMCLTGMRVAEAKNLKISDCKTFLKDDVTYLKVFVHGKSKSRELVAQDEGAIVLDKLIYFHKENARLHNWVFNDGMYLFSDQYGNRVKSFATALNRALSDADLLIDPHGTKRSGGAFRKYYITNALLNGNINYFELAKQTGNSVAVIEKYYAEIDPTQRPEMFIFKNALSGIYDDNPAQKK